VAIMAQHRIGSVLVMEGNRLVGIFTERDTVRALSSSYDAPGHEVSAWMTHNPITVRPETPTADAMRTMLANNFRHLPVMEGDDVAGIVSIRDLAR
jgi:CBS domain-containing protein